MAHSYYKRKRFNKMAITTEYYNLQNPCATQLYNVTDTQNKFIVCDSIDSCVEYCSGKDNVKPDQCNGCDDATVEKQMFYNMKGAECALVLPDWTVANSDKYFTKENDDVESFGAFCEKSIVPPGRIPFRQMWTNLKDNDNPDEVNPEFFDCSKLDFKAALELAGITLTNGFVISPAYNKSFCFAYGCTAQSGGISLTADGNTDTDANTNNDLGIYNELNLQDGLNICQDYIYASNSGKTITSVILGAIFVGLFF